MVSPSHLESSSEINIYVIGVKSTLKNAEYDFSFVEHKRIYLTFTTIQQALDKFILLRPFYLTFGLRLSMDSMYYPEGKLPKEFKAMGTSFDEVELPR